jgi:hypothetical protein
LHCEYTDFSRYIQEYLTICRIYNAVIGFGLLFTYFPHVHTRADGFSRRAILKKIDYAGGILSITGLTLL